MFYNLPRPKKVTIMHRHTTVVFFEQQGKLSKLKARQNLWWNMSPYMQNRKHVNMKQLHGKSKHLWFV